MKRVITDWLVTFALAATIWTLMALAALVVASAFGML